ncbi:MAG: septum site-determining protein MinD [Clostridia bacterium]|nr:septum site-determining protein MinD [Clostridia bacterium]
MAKKIVVTSGKGGVGKTTVTANLGYHLAKRGKRVLLVDCDFGLNNLDVVVNIENQIVFDLIDVLENRCRIKQAVIESPLNANLFIIPCTHSAVKGSVTSQSLKLSLERLEDSFDYILLDCPAGIDVGFHRAVSIANEALIVTTPHITSIRDADKVTSILKSYKLPTYAVINRMRGDLVLNGQMYSREDISNILKVDVIGIIPDDDLILGGVAELSYSAPYKAFSLFAQSLIKGNGKVYDYLSKYSGFFGSIRKELKKRL